MKENKYLQPLLPVLIGLLGCLLPDSRYEVQGERFATMPFSDFSGWGTILLLFVFGFYVFVNTFRQRPVNRLLCILMGFYLLGFVLFRLYHTFTLFRNDQTDSLSEKLHAVATPAEGLLLLGLSGIWLLYRAIKP